MRKLFAAIFGSSENTKTVVDGAVAGIDKMFFTDEEKSDASAKASEWFLRYLAATEPQNLARRLIALIIVILWAGLIVVGVVAKGVEIWLFGLELAPDGSTLFSEFVFEVLASVVMNPFLMVMGFYFAAHVVRAWTGQGGRS